MVLALTFSSGCARRSIYKTTQEPYPPKKLPDDVELISQKDDVEDVYRELAYVDSIAFLDPTSEEVERMKLDLQRKGAMIGADAILDISMLEERHRGIVRDYDAPVWMMHLGNEDQKFLRGLAVTFQLESD